MKNKFYYFSLRVSVCSGLFLLLAVAAFAQKTALGIFEGQTDVGKVRQAGKATYKTTTGEYELTGSGTNMWGTHDEFHFVWKRLKGDFILYTRGQLLGKGVDPHRKIGWIVRQSLDSSAAHVNASVHGDGLTALQYRRTSGAATEEIRSTVTGPDVIQLERRGGKYTMKVAKFGQPFVSTELTNVDLGDQVYVGLFVCSHNPQVSERGMFRDVRISVPARANFVPYKEYIGSQIELLEVATGNRQIIYNSPKSLQAPNWTPDGKRLIYNAEGLMYTFDLAKRTPQALNTDYVKKNNNDHVLSFDGKMLGLSSSGDDPKQGSQVYTVPITGGKPKLITPTGPSYLHGWSPDSKTLLFTGERNKEFDIYKVPASGGPETRLTTAQGLDDGSEYTPDGKWVYFNSNRSGTMQIWRMRPDGSQQEAVTTGEFHDWFPHVSPDGKWIVMLSFNKDEVKSGDHPFYKHVYLRLMPITGGTPKVIAYVYGGQGSINTPSWSPDSKRIAFISNTDTGAAPAK
ncbi:biopolymer transporter TolR [Adhaeribacter arboris]|uniref:Biopolymer transporter TolR n=1 Tax=Adhaeribacter arboris TaxID=2072846 RepID=A0A2T2Y9F1_9BACT|nr:TolB family protein [Adhaeribacter arboris]PSR52144.1 biopolymer transporter TolR [Adhaeribacter arboris]